MSTSDNINIKNLNIQKLKDMEGYPTWKARLSIALHAMSLWGIVDGTRSKDEVADKPEELAKWTKDNDHTMFFIMALISDEVLMNSNHTLAKELWDSIPFGIWNCQGRKRLPRLPLHHYHEDVILR